MTKEEALKTWLPIISMSIDNIPELEEAFDMAVKALEQEPTTKNDLAVNCISRPAAIDAIKRIHPIDTDYNCTLLDKVDVMYVLNNLPSVTPQEPILDKIREQIKDYLRGVEITLEVLVENDPLRPKMEGAKDTLEECLNLIDKAKAEADNG